jgi:hypothetical protein
VSYQDCTPSESNLQHHTGKMEITTLNLHHLIFILIKIMVIKCNMVMPKTNRRLPGETDARKMDYIIYYEVSIQYAITGTISV